MSLWFFVVETKDFGNISQIHRMSITFMTSLTLWIFMTLIVFAKLTSPSIPTQSQCSVFWDDHWLELDVLYKISIPLQNQYISLLRELPGSNSLNHPRSALPNIFQTIFQIFPLKEFSEISSQRFLIVVVNLILFTFLFHCLKLFLQVNQSWTDCLFHPTSPPTLLHFGLHQITSSLWKGRPVIKRAMPKQGAK